MLQTKNSINSAGLTEWLQRNDRSLISSLDALNRIKIEIGRGDYGREISLAITHLEECEMWINKIINRLTAPKYSK